MNTYDWLLVVIGILYVLACAFLVLVVLVQEGKSGGLAGGDAPGAAPGALSDSFGVGEAQKNLFRVTSWSAGAFLVLALALTIIGEKKERTGGLLELDETDTPASLTIPAAGSSPVTITDVTSEPGAPGSTGSGTAEPTGDVAPATTP